jgi:hypothetical protein
MENHPLYREHPESYCIILNLVVKATTETGAAVKVGKLMRDVSGKEKKTSENIRKVKNLVEDILKEKT